MRKILIVLFLIPFVVFGQQKFDFSDSSVEMRLRLDLYYLASDSLKGRESGTLNEIKARDYILNEFKKAGLSPYSIADSNYFQEFEFSKNYWDEEMNTLAVDDLEYNLWLDFYPLAYVGEGYVSGSAEIVDALLIDTLKLMPAVNGKIVFLTNLLPPADQKKSFSLDVLLPFLEKQGALAIVNVPNSDFYSFYASKASCNIPVLVFDKLNFDKIDLTKSNDISLQLYKQTNYKIYNVIGCIDNNASSTIILGAHYDHLGTRKDVVSGDLEIYNGADDNASGTVAVLEMARYLKQEGPKNYNFVLCAFSGEENGLLGSVSFTESDYYKSLSAEEIKFMLDFDMIGRLGSFGNVLFVNGVGSSRQWKKIIRKNPSENFRIKKIPDGMNGSDDYPFYKKEIPVLFFITGLHKEYHTTEDVASKINYKGEVQIIDYAKKLISVVTPERKLKFRKVNFWQTITSYIVYAKMFL